MSRRDRTWEKIVRQKPKLLQQWHKQKMNSENRTSNHTYKSLSESGDFQASL